MTSSVRLGFEKKLLLQISGVNSLTKFQKPIRSRSFQLNFLSFTCSHQHHLPGTYELSWDSSFPMIIDDPGNARPPGWSETAPHHALRQWNHRKLNMSHSSRHFTSKEEERASLEDLKDHIDDFVNASKDEHKTCFKKTMQKLFGMSKIVVERSNDTTKV